MPFLFWEVTLASFGQGEVKTGAGDLQEVVAHDLIHPLRGCHAHLASKRKNGEVFFSFSRRVRASLAWKNDGDLLGHGLKFAQKDGSKRSTRKPEIANSTRLRRSACQITDI